LFIKYGKIYNLSVRIYYWLLTSSFRWNNHIWINCCNICYSLIGLHFPLSYLYESNSCNLYSFWWRRYFYNTFLRWIYNKRIWCLLSYTATTNQHKSFDYNGVKGYYARIDNINSNWSWLRYKGFFTRVGWSLY